MDRKLTARRLIRKGNPDYEADTHAWLERQVDLLRAGCLAQVDAENVAEELEGIAKNYRRELRSRLDRLLAYLLTYEVQPLARSGSWRGTIAEQRIEIRELLIDSPSLRRTLAEAFGDPRRYSNAVRLAVAESGLAYSAFPKRCPYSFKQVLCSEFWPGAGPHPEFRATKPRKKRA